MTDHDPLGRYKDLIGCKGLVISSADPTLMIENEWTGRDF